MCVSITVQLTELCNGMWFNRCRQPVTGATSLARNHNTYLSTCHRTPLHKPITNLHNKYLRRELTRHHHLRIQSAVIPLLCHTHGTQHRVVWVAFRTLMLLLSHFRLYGKACMHSTKTNDDDCLFKWRALKRCERTQTHTHPYMEQNTCFGASSLPASR